MPRPSPRKHWFHAALSWLEDALFSPSNSAPVAATSNRARGASAEDLAARHLTGKGYRLLHRNWTCRLGELDIVARQGERLVVVEVKFGKARPGIRPSMHIDQRKQRQLWKLTEQYMKAHGLLGQAVRVDVIEVIQQANGPSLVEHFEGAVENVRR